ncbi:MAG: hypothetical protein NWQ92_00670 [Sphingorhabdus sp.]|uniref:hypothetical protein n=1 Tax=Sphingorhabdus sp. TaxID=1902408 RepID=UPI00273D7A60|nr:hypothetical protein [Sphingorhabdus sp.]MDP4871912.1 hypothetical protein [Sphingorhabdus sp.]
MQKICFLFNHDQTHQIAHSLPIALQMAKSGAADVTLAVTNTLVEAEIRRLSGAALEGMKIVPLQTKSTVSQILVRALDSLVPARKLLVYRDNLDFFRQFDALVVSEKSSLILKTRYGLKDVKFIHTRHGAGDRAIGFNAESAQFDLILVSGEKIRDRLVRDAGVPPEKIRITGYAKFDIVVPEQKPLFPASDRRTILYNPHPSPHLSSWFKFGAEVLEQFYQSGRYNLIFAPHLMLFARPWTVTIDRLSIASAKKPAARYHDAAHMLIDLGSPACTNMTYTNAADLYLGDVSSQVYEFLHRPRPCLFLDAHDTQWQGNPNYRHWTTGPVKTDAKEIIDAVDAAFATQASYNDAQRNALADSFSVTDTAASVRAAAAIIDYLEQAIG